MNPQDGPALYSALKQVRAFHESVALLLRTADGWLGQHERALAAIHRSTALYGGTASLDQPGAWLPHLAFRYYAVPSAPDVVAFVSVIMCPRHPGGHARPFTEPLVSAGWMRFTTVPDPFRSYWWAGMLTWSDVPRDGTVAAWAAPDPASADHDMVESRVLGVPLVRLADSVALVSEVLAPLVDSLPRAAAGGGRDA